jgi:hypothetical protein
VRGGFPFTAAASWWRAAVPAQPAWFRQLSVQAARWEGRGVRAGGCCAVGGHSTTHGGRSPPPQQLRLASSMVAAFCLCVSALVLMTFTTTVLPSLSRRALQAGQGEGLIVITGLCQHPADESKTADRLVSPPRMAAAALPAPASSLSAPRLLVLTFSGLCAAVTICCYCCCCCCHAGGVQR